MSAVIDRPVAQLLLVQPTDVERAAPGAAGGDTGEQPLAVGIVDVGANSAAVADAAQTACGIEGAALPGTRTDLAAVGIVGVAGAVVTAGLRPSRMGWQSSMPKVSATLSRVGAAKKRSA